ncbi:prominin-1-A-like isoform X1 [Mizuhopecten yessoensis]|uniref:prominin-1-A-like isoform X1 n=1 Tax=Mizuhopecten yessoensis TaxID=6573 RepID=UPI000B45CB34|nr:prominin-1-A-like isoform X1 [Mizuhopecten yessoensis]XP_021352520.1 prominin-1-A-like isoform X1 [Mizuhopecten yessoensis]XP_021352522.1 prominin-1-A-like isoform X1 [Mizuhopecten yessoensis]XP_021352523.1 prominin-1-A-like isoform X1 [Mizuhopecten yessoensis]XP_021352524.1 prominin-1-A-like isoform X1 [Mizuhopecten yessoensis]
MELIGKTVIFVLSLCVIIVTGRHTADPAISQATVTDATGNSADENSTITWATLTTTVNYKADDLSYSDGGMSTLNSMAKGFVNVCFPAGFPWDVVDKLMDGTLMDDVSSNWQSYASQFAGYVVSIVIGFLFIFLFPLIGCCFCCCRCCGCCGGKMIQKRKDTESSCRRKVYIVSLFIVIVFMASGMVCVYISNDQFTKTVDTIDTSVANTLDDLLTFVNATIDQIELLVQDNFNFTTDVVKRDLDSIGYLLGVPLRNAIGVDSGLDACFATTYTLVESANNATTDLLQVNTSMAVLNSAFSDLSTALSTLKTSLDTTLASCGAIQTTCNGIDTTPLTTEMDATALPDISSQLTKATEIQDSNLTAKVLEGEEGYWQIPWTVHNETNNTIASIKDKIDEFSDLINPLIDSLSSVRSSVLSSVDTDALLDDFSSQMTTAKTYDQYRWYGGVGLACIVLLVVVLQLLGLVFALIGYDSKVDPRERGCMSNSGGEMFMASVGFVFIFSSLLMLLTTLTYLIGAPLERFVCQPITDSDMTDLDRLVDEVAFKQLYGGTGSVLGKMLYSNSTYDIPISGLLKDCQASKTVYMALKADTYVNTSQIDNYKTEFDIQSELDKIDDAVDFSSIAILTPSLLSNLEDTKSAVNVDFASYAAELNKDLTSTNLTEFADSLRTLATAAGAAGETSTQNDLNTHAATLDTIQSTEVAALNEAVANLTRDLDNMAKTVNGTSAKVDKVIECLNQTELYIHANTSALLGTLATNFADRIFASIDSFISKLFTALKTELGKCDPIWNLYNNFFVITLCGYTVDTLNGFWFGLGWCLFFFIPSIIFAVKLAKHFRRMKEVETVDEHFEDPNYEKRPVPEQKRIDHRPVFKGFTFASVVKLPKSNKVSHADDPEKNGQTFPTYAEAW